MNATGVRIYWDIISICNPMLKQLSVSEILCHFAGRVNHHKLLLHLLCVTMGMKQNCDSPEQKHEELFTKNGPVFYKRLRLAINHAAVALRARSAPSLTSRQRSPRKQTNRLIY